MFVTDFPFDATTTLFDCYFDLDKTKWVKYDDVA